LTSIFFARFCDKRPVSPRYCRQLPPWFYCSLAPQTALGRRPGRAGFHGWDLAMLEQIKRAAEVDADVIGNRLSAPENIHGLRISGKGRLAVFR
jgi:hypothetical protein